MSSPDLIGLRNIDMHEQWERQRNCEHAFVNCNQDSDVCSQCGLVRPRVYAPRYPWHSTEADYKPLTCKHCGELIRQVVETWIHSDDNVFCRPRQFVQAEPTLTSEKEK